MSYVPAQRDLQPNESGPNSSFIDAYVARTSLSTPHEGPVPDDDATLGRVIRKVLNALIPQTFMTDATIRITPPSHVALPAILVRHFFEFTVLLAVCLIFRHFDQHRTAIIGIWCIGTLLLAAMLRSLAKEDTTLFFFKLEKPLTALAFPVLFFFVYWQSALEGIRWALAGYLLYAMLAFPSGDFGANLARRALRLAAAIGLAFCLPDFQTLIDHRIAASAFVILVGNFVLLLPIPFAMQHWFAAQRYAVLEDIRSYGPDAPIYYGNARAVLSGIFALFVATGTAVACAICFLLSLSNFGPDWDWTVHAVTAVLWFVAMLVFGFVNRVFSYPKSLQWSTVNDWNFGYATWRALAAWMGHDPPLKIPAVFQFQRPWSVRSVRVGLVSCALGLNSLITLLILTPTIESFLTQVKVPFVAQDEGNRPEAVSQSDTVVLCPTASERYEETLRRRPFSEAVISQPSGSLTDNEAIHEFLHSQQSDSPVQFSDPQPKPEQMLSPPAPRQELAEVPLWNRLGVFAAAIFIAALAPPAILFAMLCACWGPLFLAYNNHFELFDEDIRPPILTFSLKATRKRWLSA